MAAESSAESRMQQKLHVALCAGDRRIDHCGNFTTLLANALGHTVDGKLMGSGIANDAALAYMLTASLKLRFNEDDGLDKGWRGCKHGRKNQSGRDKGNIHDEQRRKRLDHKRAWFEQTRIGSLHEPNAWVIAELHGDLAEACVNGCYAPRAVLQETIRKAAGGSSYIETGTVRHID